VKDESYILSFYNALVKNEHFYTSLNKSCLR